MMRFAGLLYGFFAFAGLWLDRSRLEKEKKSVRICLYLLLLSDVACLFAYCYYSSIDGKGKWAFEVSKQTSKQMLLG